MRSTTVSSKGQIVIPKELREQHGWSAGTVLEIEEQGDAVVLRAAPLACRTSIEDLVGCAGYKGPRKSLKDLELAIAKGALRSR